MQRLDLQKLKNNIETRAAKNVAEANVGAAAIAVTQDNKIVFKGFFGEMTQQNGEKVGERTMYRLASMSKPITAIAIGILWSRNLISLDDTIEKYIPVFHGLRIRNLDADGNIVDLGAVQTAPTIFHLLTHTSGIGSDTVFEREWVNFTLEDLVTLETSMPVYAAAGTAFEPFSRELYSGVEGFDILARIVEIVSGQSYDEFLRENIFIPCDMPDTTFVPTQEQWGRMITMHEKVDGKNAVGKMSGGIVFDKIPVTHFSGAAGLAGTLSDYLHFAEMLLNKGEYHGFHVVPEEYIALMSRPHIPEDMMPGGQKWGFGVRCIINENYLELPVGAFGWSGAYGTHFWIDPANRITAVYMKNCLTDGGSGAKTAVELEQDVTAALIGE